MNDLPPLAPLPAPATKSPNGNAMKPTLLRRSILIPTAIAAAGLLVGGAIGWGITALATTPTIAQHEDEITSLEADLTERDADLQRTEERLASAQDDLLPQRELEGREKAIENAEADMAEREAAVADVAEREAAVKAREDAAAENARSGDWWIDQVRECLARPGSYRMASATEGSLGNDVSCMSG